MPEKDIPEQIGHKPEFCFPTPLWIQQLTDYQRINTEILNVLSQLAVAEDSSGIIRSNVGGWHSQADLHKRKDLAEISQAILVACTAGAKKMDFDFESYKLSIIDMWINRNGPGDLNRPHVHPHAMLSGVYYVQVPSGSGNFECFDPVSARVSTAYPVISGRSGYAPPSIEITPVEGGLVIFPSWLLHWVQLNNSKGDRVSISFNVGYRPKK